MDLKKKCQDVCKIVSASWKKYYFSDRNARKYWKSKIDFKNVFLRVFRHFDSQFYIFFEKLRLFFWNLRREPLPETWDAPTTRLCIKAQSQYDKKLKSDLKPGEFLGTADFAENYAFVGTPWSYTIKKAVN